MKMGLMTESGLKAIEIAKENGSWTILDSVEKLEIPSDLEKQFKQFPKAKEYFMGLSKSFRKGMLYWIVSAKRPETRQKRIHEIINSAKVKKKPKQF